MSNSFPRISNAFPRIGQVVLSDCNSFPRITDCPIRKNELSNSRERIAIRENELSNSRERITNPWERIAQFDITIYLRLFMKIPMSLQGFRRHYTKNDTIGKTKYDTQISAILIYF